MYKSSLIYIVGIMTAIVLPVVIFFQSKVGKLFIMKTHEIQKKFITYVKKWEGGLSRDPKDTASSHPAPWVHNGQKGWHTNMGVTYRTFSSMAPRLGYPATADNFFNMPHDLWYKILIEGYAKPFNVEQLNHIPLIQMTIINWAWGSGVGSTTRGATFYLGRFLREQFGIKDDNITASKIVPYFRANVTATNQKEVFHKMCDRRLADFKRMTTWNVHGRGWTNRLNDYRNTFG